jgi:signal peptidase I
LPAPHYPAPGYPKIARFAYIVAFLVAGGTAISALAGQIFLLPFALIPLIAGIGIIRRRAWSAWGFALYTFAQLLPVAGVLFRSSSFRSTPPGAVGAVALAVILIPLFLFAGRSLAATGAASGRAWPWIAASALTGLSVFFIQVFVVPTATMEDTLLAGDWVLVQHFPKLKPARGDMIVFVYPIDRRQTFVKRVIGVPGDRIRISNKIVYRNGAALREPYAVHKTDYIDAYRDNFPSEPDVALNAPALNVPAKDMLRKHVLNGEVVVPDGEYFVLGDNRDLSLDSRYWGFIDAGDLIGKPLLIYDSEDQTTRTVRWGRLFTLL